MGRQHCHEAKEPIWGGEVLSVMVGIFNGLIPTNQYYNRCVLLSLWILLLLQCHALWKHRHSSSWAYNGARRREIGSTWPNKTAESFCFIKVRSCRFIWCSYHPGTATNIQRSLTVPSPLPETIQASGRPNDSRFPFRTSWFDFRHKMSRVLNQVPAVGSLSSGRSLGHE